MFNRRARFLFASPPILATLFLSGCLSGPEGPSGPALTGTLSGYVTLVKANGGQPAVRDSVQVAVDGTTREAFTDKAGKWTLPDLKTGIYTLTFSKSDYAPVKSVQLQFTGGSDKDLGVTFLCQPPAFSASGLQVLGLSGSRADSGSVYLGVTLSDSGVTGPYRTYLVLSPDTGLSVTPTLRSTGSFNVMSFVNGVDSSGIRLTSAALATDGFAPGDTVYAAAFAANAGSNNSGYLDTLTGKTIYTNVNGRRSNVVKFAVPKFTGPQADGSLSGSVITVQADGDQHFRRDSVTVSVEGTDWSARTDAYGNWNIPGVKAGAYTLDFSKQGYANAKANVNLANGTNKNIGTTYLCMPPDFSVQAISILPYTASRSDSASIYVEARLSDSTAQGLYRVYLVISLDSNLASAADPVASGSFYNAYFRKGDNTSDLRLTPAIFANAGFAPGNTLYARAYAANAGNVNSSYPDSASGKPIYTNLNSKVSNTLKFTVP